MISPNKKASDSPTPEDQDQNSGQARNGRSPGLDHGKAAPPAPEEQIRVAVGLAQDRKADAIQVLNLGKISDFTDYFLICSGSNERQVQAIGEAIVKGLRDLGSRPLHTEGQNLGRWILLDYGGDLVIHVFLDETRRHYSLERLWADAPDETERFLKASPATD